VTYSLTAPAGAAEGTYNVTGTVTADEVSNVVGGQITVGIGVTGDGTATATRSIAVTTLMPGGSTEVTVEFTSLLGETKSFALQENIPAGWTLTQGTDDASAFQPTTNTWVWFSVTAGATKTVTYSLTALRLLRGSATAHKNTGHCCPGFLLLSIVSSSELGGHGDI
jgi:hypothetical protein